MESNLKVKRKYKTYGIKESVIMAYSLTYEIKVILYHYRTLEKTVHYVYFCIEVPGTKLYFLYIYYNLSFMHRVIGCLCRLV